MSASFLRRERMAPGLRPSCAAMASTVSPPMVPAREVALFGLGPGRVGVGVPLAKRGHLISFRIGGRAGPGRFDIVLRQTPLE